MSKSIGKKLISMALCVVMMMVGTMAFAAEVFEAMDEFYGGYVIVDQYQVMPRNQGVRSSRGYMVGFWTFGTPGAELFSNLQSRRDMFPDVSTIRTSVENGNGDRDCTGFIFTAQSTWTHARSSVSRSWTGTNRAWWDYRPAG